ncbi:hypothetical protein F5X98DRAFT_58828 [Xylaria grammica]|nr:hypothetical protein F5X98DRAFT_58828 [Xylaria grammica]
MCHLTLKSTPCFSFQAPFTSLGFFICHSRRKLTTRNVRLGFSSFPFYRRWPLKTLSFGLRLVCRSLRISRSSLESVATNWGRFLIPHSPFFRGPNWGLSLQLSRTQVMWMQLSPQSAFYPVIRRLLPSVGEEYGTGNKRLPPNVSLSLSWAGESGADAVSRLWCGNTDPYGPTVLVRNRDKNRMYWFDLSGITSQVHHQGRLAPCMRAMRA